MRWWNAYPREQGRLTFRGLAIVMCLAMVGIALMPLAVGDIGAVVYGVHWKQPVRTSKQ